MSQQGEWWRLSFTEGRLCAGSLHPSTQIVLRILLSVYLKCQGSWCPQTVAFFHSFEIKSAPLASHPLVREVLFLPPLQVSLPHLAVQIIQLSSTTLLCLPSLLLYCLTQYHKHITPVLALSEVSPPMTACITNIFVCSGKEIRNGSLWCQSYKLFHFGW